MIENIPNDKTRGNEPSMISFDQARAIADQVRDESIRKHKYYLMTLVKEAAEIGKYELTIKNPDIPSNCLDEVIKSLAYGSGYVKVNYNRDFKKLYLCWERKDESNGIGIDWIKPPAHKDKKWKRWFK